MTRVDAAKYVKVDCPRQWQMAIETMRDRHLDNPTLVQMAEPLTGIKNLGPMSAMEILIKVALALVMSDDE